MPRLDPTAAARLSILAVAVFLSACEKAPPPAAPSTPPAAKVEPTSPPAMPPAAARLLSAKIESFTGARTLIVWAQCQDAKQADPLSNKREHLLMGLDSGDAKGPRAILTRQGNYTRPLITSDGGTILFTNKIVTRDAEDTKHYAATIMRTDWKGTMPVKLADGYAAGTWVDPVSHIEWVYAVEDILPSPLAALEARRLVRFPLDDPAKGEVVWEKTKLSPDNVQLSRDGARASVQAPQPDAGIFFLGEKSEFKRLAAGAWPSMAPDDSHVSWVLDDTHKSLTLYAEESAKPWSVALDTDRDLMQGEAWHPRWTNHPRFIALTGPYVADAEGGSAIGRGGLTSEVFIGRFGEKLDKIDGWLRVTDNSLNDMYPDVWIAGGDHAVLDAFPQEHRAKSAAEVANWPPTRESMIFVWQSGAMRNRVKLTSGREIDCGLQPQRNARFGRSFDMLLDGGTFTPPPDSAQIIADATNAAMPMTVEFVIHLHEPGAFATLMAIPNLRLSIRDGVINAETTRGIIGVGPVTGGVAHFSATVAENGYSFTLRQADGKSSTRLSPAKPRPDAGKAAPLTFGGISGKGIGLSHVAVFARKLGPEELNEHAEPLATLAKAPPPVLRLHGTLVTTSAMPAAEEASALVTCIYEVMKVTEGGYAAKRVLVRHWARLNGRTTNGFPRKPGAEYDLTLEPFSEQPQLDTITVMPLDAGDLEPFFDVTTPLVSR